MGGGGRVGGGGGGRVEWGGGQGRCEQRSEEGGRADVNVGGGRRGGGRCERRSEVFVKISKKKIGVGGGGRVWGVGDRVEGGGQRCEQRSEVFVKIQKKKNWGVGGGGGGGGRVVGGGVRVDTRYKNFIHQFWAQQG